MVVIHVICTVVRFERSSASSKDDGMLFYSSVWLLSICCCGVTDLKPLLLKKSSEAYIVTSISPYVYIHLRGGFCTTSHCSHIVRPNRVRKNTATVLSQLGKKLWMLNYVVAEPPLGARWVFKMQRWIVSRDCQIIPPCLISTTKIIPTRCPRWRQTTFV